MYTIENHVGRLVELRVESPVTYEELLEFHDRFARVARPIGGQVLVCTDLLGAKVFSQPVTERWTSVIRQESPIVERNAILVGEGAVFSMQVERIIREAGYTNRRAFRSPAEMSAWLGEVMNPAERARLGIYLRDGVESRKRMK